MADDVAQDFLSMEAVVKEREDGPVNGSSIVDDDRVIRPEAERAQLEE